MCTSCARPPAGDHSLCSTVHQALRRDLRALQSPFVPEADSLKAKRRLRPVVVRQHHKRNRPGRDGGIHASNVSTDQQRLTSVQAAAGPDRPPNRAYRDSAGVSPQPDPSRRVPEAFRGDERAGCRECLDVSKRGGRPGAPTDAFRRRGPERRRHAPVEIADRLHRPATGVRMSAVEANRDDVQSGSMGPKTMAGPMPCQRLLRLMLAGRPRPVDDVTPDERLVSLYEGKHRLFAVSNIRGARRAHCDPRHPVGANLSRYGRVAGMNGRTRLSIFPGRGRADGAVAANAGGGGISPLRR